MFKRIGYWIFLFVLSFALTSCGLGVQGQIFLYLYIGINAFMLLIQNFDHPIGIIISTTLVYAFILFITWIISKIFNTDFYITFEILALIISIFGINVRVTLS